MENTIIAPVFKKPLTVEYILLFLLLQIMSFVTATIVAAAFNNSEHNWIILVSLLYPLAIYWIQAKKMIKTGIFIAGFILILIIVLSQLPEPEPLIYVLFILGFGLFYIFSLEQESHIKTITKDYYPSLSTKSNTLFLGGSIVMAYLFYNAAHPSSMVSIIFYIIIPIFIFFTKLVVPEGETITSTYKGTLKDTWGFYILGFLIGGVCLLMYFFGSEKYPALLYLGLVMYVFGYWFFTANIGLKLEKILGVPPAPPFKL